MESARNGVAFLAIAGGLLLIAACAGVGPRTVARDRFDYNGEVARSWKEQTLLNIVKSRYLDVPVFLDVTQIVSSYALESSASIGGMASIGGGVLDGDAIQLGAQAKWTDRPTITYQPLTGAQFNRNMMTPIPPSAVLFTIQAGWPLDLVFRLTVSKINGIDSRGPDAPRYDRVIFLLRSLQQAEAFVMRVQQQQRGEDSVVVSFGSRARTPEQDAMLRELQEILGLEPGRTEFTVIFGVIPANAGEITMLTRSMMQILLALGAYVDVPDADLAEGRAAPSESLPVGTGLGQLRVRYSRERPTDALVAVAQRGGWFWIDDRDTASKSTFALVMLLSTLAETGPRETPPLLTIPAG
jgi:hypothetical protein